MPLLQIIFMMFFSRKQQRWKTAVKLFDNHQVSIGLHLSTINMTDQTWLLMMSFRALPGLRLGTSWFPSFFRLLVVSRPNVTRLSKENKTYRLDRKLESSSQKDGTIIKWQKIKAPYLEMEEAWMYLENEVFLNKVPKTIFHHSLKVFLDRIGISKAKGQPRDVSKG